MAQPTLFMMLGYPGAGKTTTAEAVANLTGAFHLASDIFRLQMFPNPQFTAQEHQQLYAALNEQTKQFLQQGRSVVYDANLNRYQHRVEKYQLCSQIGANPVLLWVKTPTKIAKTRAVNLSRSDLWPEGESADKMFDRLVSVFEEPRPSENYIELDGTKITPEYVQQQLHQAGMM